MSQSALSTATRRMLRFQNISGVASIHSTSIRTLNWSCHYSPSLCESTPRRSVSYLCLSRGNSAALRTIPTRSTAYSVIPTQRSAFSSSVIRPASKVVQNPRVDEDGKTLMIDISPRAAERLREITDPSSSPSITKEENPYHHLRITVTSGGCHGFQYLMSLEAASKIDPEEDTIFESEPVDGPTSGSGEAKVVMDEPSLELLSGSTVDYTMELIGSQFKIVDNPRATSNCGCGTSFDVKD
ncbi:HesB/IscA family protein [Aspergillus clavatus NRRL 1]|uniref:Iron-sulfur cluster assembly accessory protein Isa2, putative n=1 Tax=Aspergillus clavatus (strain ATCC 1007 / CBS 513.65 / DSM 816 / NCTC 3887 / NRRL 1 / QM 1276 / 107) TaxID=344612 RepID=A1C689_ASPCL|nr:iron-sulfur cluster assembly accessory protein Isa2, putative [Aspergillus clavatus NRRL 1]EAW13910.1 iron-sulfur cluster assembly accessory protein Isa2, putative [Aspergillus clavatus NRRL 1]